MSDNYLIHYGVLGQKWGVRRYEGENGKLTAAGKKRYSDYNYKRGSDLKSRISNRRQNRIINKQNKKAIRSDDTSLKEKRMYRIANKKEYKRAQLANSSAVGVGIRWSLKSLGVGLGLGALSAATIIATAGAATPFVSAGASFVASVASAGILVKDIQDYADARDNG